ncbi:MAG: hypothetical protein KKD38_10015 [Candidatus Delongbacteria bacterium]|nr:hypothetical protein [Candidatus Delongbacteria bacterium]MCG2759783.1 hypothetical protein [Candidatus Delongbacteria bacterium]
MRELKRHKFIFLILFYTMKVVSSENSLDNFKLELITRSEYEAGQPVVVNFRITNNSGSDAMFVYCQDGFDLSRYYDLKEGVYTVTCHYSTDAQKESQWYGAYSDDYWEKIYENTFWIKLKPDMEKCSQMLKKVPKVDIATEPVKIAIIKGLYITKEKAFQIAKNVCAQEKWKWDDDKISITDQGSEWHIMTNNNSLGMNAIINIDKRTGEVISKFMTGP